MSPLPHPTVELLVDGARSQGAYAVLDIRLPIGLELPRHVRRGHSAIARLLEGVVELRRDDQPPEVVRDGLLMVAEGHPIALRVLAPARLVALLVPAGSAELLKAAADPRLLDDDRSALLAAAGITTLPSLR